MSDRALRLADALDKTGESRTSFYRRIQAGIYPQPIRLGHSARWLESELDAALARAKAERDGIVVEAA